ncbi:serine acetyltransferase 5-like isoform X2 [Chenopodium quinoa]|uniref:serine acetyltransferase 5-like isoform X2 n=1 Tax=Chenopodium quinoa TaxID=63459 RepID=UPI000B798555|nr:serine acetyltransferase 5-like isoform X2 [Chenopodium quinoa]
MRATNFPSMLFIFLLFFAPFGAFHFYAAPLSPSVFPPLKRLPSFLFSTEEYSVVAWKFGYWRSIPLRRSLGSFEKNFSHHFTVSSRQMLAVSYVIPSSCINRFYVRDFSRDLRPAYHHLKYKKRFRCCSTNQESCSLGSATHLPTMPGGEFNVPPSVPQLPAETNANDEAWLWAQIKAEARRDADSEPALASYLYSTILSHSSLERSLSFHLGNKLCSSTLLSTLLYDLFLNILSSDSSLLAAVVADLRAARVRDPACVSFSHCLLNYKGFLACQSHRVAHKLWNQDRRPLALALHSRISDVFAVDIHPAARIGKGILFDHATGVVIGETATIGDNCSILHHVTLGGTGKAGGDRHPKVGDGVLIGAGATILGNVRIGDGAKIGAGSVVLIDVPPRTTAVGNPARLVGGKEKPSQNADVPGESMDHTSFISEWSDYII